MKRKRIKRLGIVLSVVLICVVTLLLAPVIGASGATYDTWDKLDEPYFMSGRAMWSLSDITTYNYQGTSNTSKIYSDCSHYFDDMKLDTNSRVTYGKKIRVDKGQEISVVAAQEDTADEGGASVNAGMYFYWSIQEYNSEGILVYDGDWRSSSETWIVGETMNNESAYGENGYPYGSGANERADVKYIVLIFRWNNGDLVMGSGMDTNLKASIIVNKFPNFYLAFKPFNYTFDCNGGTATVDGSNVSKYTRGRLGISNMKDLVVEPVRDGYTFAGWNLKNSNGGKQDGKTYSTDQLNAMFRDGKYWSSLFSHVLFEAQWYPPFEIAYDSNGGMASDGTKTYSHTVKYGEVYNYSSNPFSKNGYVFLGWNTKRDGTGEWYNVSDTFINLTAENGGAIKLYAQWGAARSFVEYYGNGNTEGSNYIKGYWAINNDKYDDGSAFSKKGHSIDYWSVFSQAGFDLGNKTGNDYIEDVKGTTIIKPKNNESSCVDIAGADYSDYAPVGVYPCNSADNQLFAFQWAGKDERGDYYIIRSNASGKVLDVNGAIMDGDSNKHEVRLFKHTSDSVFQQWYVEINNDYVKIRSRWCGGYLDNYGNSLYTYTGNDNDSQKWTLELIKFNAYAHWTPGDYKITFDPNGGTLPGTGNLSNPTSWERGNRTGDDWVKVTFGKDLFYDMSGDKPTKANNKFTGWFDAKTGDQVYYDNGLCVNDTGYWEDNKWCYGENITVVAGYASTVKGVSTLKFNANGGTLTGNWTSVNKWWTTQGIQLEFRESINSSRTIGTVSVLKDNVYYNLMDSRLPVRDGCTFTGWYTEPEEGKGELVYYKDGRCKRSEYWDKDYVNVGNFDDRAKWQSDKKEVELFAHWDKTEYTVTLDLNKPAYALSSPTYDTSYSLSYNVWYKNSQNNNISHYDPALEGYEFLGWYTASTGGEQIYNKYGEYVGDTSCWDRNGNWIYNGGKTLYAHWEDKAPAASLEVNSPNNIGTSKTVSITLTDSGSGVKGYYWGTNGTDYKSNAYKSAYSSGYKSTYTASVTVTADGTYYLTAIDRNNNVSATVQVTFNKTTFNANGGTVSPAYSVNPNRAVLDMTTLTAKRTGYYGGDYSNNSGKSNDWRTSTTSLTRITSYTVIKNSTLYASWNISKYNVTVNHFVMDTSGDYSNNPDYTDSLSNISYGRTLTLDDIVKGDLLVTNGIEVDTDETGESYTITGAKTIDIYYKRLEHVVTLICGTGIKSVSGYGEYYYGEEVTINATVKDDNEQYKYSWNNWTGDISTNDKEYKFNMPAKNITATANGTENNVMSIPDIYIDNVDTEYEYDWKNMDAEYGWARETVVKTKAEDTVNDITAFLIAENNNQNGFNESHEYTVPNTEGGEIVFTEENEGIHEYTIEAKNAAGKIRTQKITTHIDRTAPEISGVEDVYGWVNRSITVNITATDNLSGVKSVTLYDDNGNVLESKTEGFSYQFMEEQNKSYYIEAVDNVGNTSTKTFTIKIDKTAPVYYDYTDTDPKQVDGKIYVYNDSDTLIEKAMDQEDLEDLSGMNFLVLYPEDNPGYIINGIRIDDNNIELTYTLQEGERAYSRWICEARDNAGNYSRKYIYFGDNFIFRIRRANCEENYK